MKRELIAKNLKRSVLFQDASASELSSHAELARVMVIPQGQYVYRKDDPSEVFYIIAMGKAEIVLTRDDGTNTIVGRIGMGGHFGETGILSAKPRS
ncbi:MAG: cyclic nucleotide-binding domain-containing protein, partial [Proteobacteria bacterium]|nr:cyclic nucleotide-binding domain-containing protein [Pseudomonadota bacterium]